MGCWGMGLNQSDEYCEVYEDFMESYDKGKAVSEICEEILSRYFKDFGKDDPILHDVYFALAKAGWMCCEQSPEILERVKAIIESGANLEFYRELGADDRDLALRQKKLRAFWDSLQTPRAKPRKRHPAPHERELPDLAAGDMLVYKAPQGQRVLIVLERIGWPTFFEDQLFCCVLQRTFARQELSSMDPLREKIGLISAFYAREFLTPSSYRKIGTVSVPEGLYAKLYPTAWNGQTLLLEGRKKDFQRDYAPLEELALGQLLAGAAPEGLSLYSRASKVSFDGGGVVQIYIQTEPREKKESGPVNGFETVKIDRLLARVGVDEDEDFYQELDGLIDSLARDTKNPAELRYAYGLLMELSQHPKSSVRMAVLRAIGVMAVRHKKAPLSETEIKDRIYAQWRQGDPAERAVLKDVMEELRRSRGWQFVLP